MGDLNLAIEKIKILECPTEEVENRVADILEYYKVGNEFTISRDEDNDNLSGAAYSIVFSGDNNHYISFYTKSGLDDYVAKVTEVRTINL